MSDLKCYRVTEIRAPHRTWDVLAKDMASAKAQVLSNEPRLKWSDLGVSVSGGKVAQVRSCSNQTAARLMRPVFPEDDE